jgi:hypothetical protein
MSSTRLRTRFRSLLAPTALVAGGLLLAGGASLFGAQSASAASVDQDDPISNVQITPDDPTLGQQLTTSIDWCAPAGAQPGDTFTLTLAKQLQNLPSSFELDDPTTGDPVANAQITGTSPSMITFTLTTYLSTHHDTCGTANVTANFDGSQVTLGESNAFVSTTGNGQSFTSEITPTGWEPTGLTDATKYGTWIAADQGRRTTTHFLDWSITTPAGPFTSAETVDTVPAGANWTFDCDAVTLENGTVTPGYTYDATDITSTVGTPGGPTYTCSPTAIDVHWPAEAQDTDLYRLTVGASQLAGTGNGDPVTYSNTQAYVHTTVDGVVNDFPVSAAMIQASATGDGAGVSNAATSTPTPSDSPSTVATPSASASGTPAAVVASDSGSSNSGGQLAFTGSNTIVPVSLGGAMVLAGLALGVFARLRPRRRRAHR